MLLIAGTNYPGGAAISRLHRIVKTETNITVHIGNLAAQSGVTRFTEINPNWIYSKEENLRAEHKKLHDFDYILFESKNKYSLEMKLMQTTHEIIEYIDCFNSIGLQYNAVFPVKIRTKPCLVILQKIVNDPSIYDWLEEDEETYNGGSSNIIRFSSVALLLEHEEFSSANENLSSPSESDTNKTIEYSDSNSLKPEKVHTKSLQMGKRKQKMNPKQKLKSIIESYFRDKGSLIEGETLNVSDTIKSKGNEELTNVEVVTHEKEPNSVRTRMSIKNIIKQEKIKQMVETISKLDMNEYCDLDILDVKDCLKKIIDEYV